MAAFQPDTTYEGGAYHPSLPNGRISGTLRVSHAGLTFVSERGSIVLPISGLKMEEGGASNRLLFFRHPSQPDWSIYSTEKSLLRHPCFQADRSLAQQKGHIRTHRWRRWAFAALFILGIPLGLWVSKGPIVKAVARSVPVSWEEKLGDLAFKEITQRGRLIEDADLAKQLETLVQPLVTGVNSGRYKFKFHLVEDSEMNAFALPGGHVAINSGLLLRAESPEEVLGVLAHEIAHVTQQHGVRNVVESAGLFLLLQAFLGNAEGMAAIVVSGSQTLMRLKFSRDHERNADAIGWDYLLAANLNPKGMISMFEKLEVAHEERKKKAGAMGGIEAPDFLSTHPDVKERIVVLQTKLARMDKKDGFTIIDLNFKEFQNSLRNRLSKKTDPKP